MKKCLIAILMAAILTSLFAVPAFAAEEDIIVPDENTVIQLPNGLTLKSELIIYDSESRASTKTAEKTYVLEAKGKRLATATLIATFRYTGSSVSVTDTDYRYTTTSGYSYSHSGITKSGGTATMKGTFKQTSNGILVGSTPFTIKMTCTSNGQIS